MLLPRVTRQSESRLATRHGEFQMVGFEGQDPKVPVIVLAVGNPTDLEWPLVRLQSKCATSETFGSFQCDCSEQLEYSMKQIQDEQNGVIIYLDQEARGTGLSAKLKIYEVMQNENLTSDEACQSLGLPIDIRNYDEAVSILFYELGLRQVRLLTNNPDKVKALQERDIDVRRVPIPVTPNRYNHAYLLEKQRRHNHDIPLLNTLIIR